ncbi:MAG: hypothetical protein HOG49_22690 [Candidatus Scalindua sp.]|jgi:ribosome-binding protein aMBF1 (putative translation factor)|nr:hypothetical protein [Candidatus Scalindua sp.]
MLTKGSDQRSQCDMCGKSGAKRIIKTDSSCYKICKACDEATDRFIRFLQVSLGTATGRPVQSC